MSEFDRLRADFEGIQKQAADAKSLELARQQAALQEEARKKEEADKRYIESQRNWPTIKARVSTVLTQMNREVFDGRGRIVPWIEMISKIHSHFCGKESSTRGSGNEERTDYFDVYKDCRSTFEMAGLEVRGIGSIFAFRIIMREILRYHHYEKPFFGGEGRSVYQAERVIEKEEENCQISFGGLYKELPLNQIIPCEVTEGSLPLWGLPGPSEKDIADALAEQLSNVFEAHQRLRRP